MSMEFDRFAFLGGGHMSTALIAGLIHSDCPADHIAVLDRHQHKRDALKDQFEVTTCDTLKAVLSNADTVVLLVRPENVVDLMQQLSVWTGPSFRLISCVSGLTCAQLSAMLQPRTDCVIRAMPNLPAKVRAGMSGLYAPSEASELDRQSAEHLLRAVGSVMWLEQEDMMHLITAVSGSGPGYVFRLMDSMCQAAIAQGVPDDQARMLVVNTFLGAARMALEQQEDLAKLCQQVCVPGGTTEQGVAVLESAQIDVIFSELLTAVVTKSKSLH